MSFQVQQQIRHNALEIRNYLSDLYDWEEKVETKKDDQPKKEIGPLPPVRGNVDIPKPVSQLEQLKRDNNNIKGYYDAWSKIDIDKEIEELDREEIFKPEELYKQSGKQKPQNSKMIIRGGYEPQKQSEAYNLKDEGNNWFKKAQYSEAIECYTKALQLLEKQENIYNDEQNLRVILLSNRAQCYINTALYLQAISDCTEALKQDSKHLKSLTRRAQAHQKLGKIKKALEDYQIASTLDKDFKKDVQQIQDKILQQKKLAKQNLRLNIDMVQEKIKKSKQEDKLITAKIQDLED